LDGVGLYSDADITEMLALYAQRWNRTARLAT